MIERKSTKQMIAESMKELLNERPLQKITVQMIVDNCQMTRQTFYQHFEDKFDLINWIFCSNIDEIIHANAQNQPWSSALEDMLVYMKRNQRFYVNTISYEGQNSFHQIITNYTCDAYARELAKRADSKNLDGDILLAIEFNSYGAVGLIYDWIRGGMKTPPHDLAKCISENMPQKMKKYFQ